MEILKNNKGFTLIESLVALVILAIVLLGLLTGLMVAIDMNTRNILRDEAVKIADKYAEICKNDITKCTSSTEERQFRNFKEQYNIDITIDIPTVTNVKIVTINVTWQYRGKNYSHTTKTAVGGT
ncbi:hypothetical protein JCM14244_01790 [Venenivibrio stagnispumantis]|uniref:Type IV pilus assembly protein PilV n=1 Tax=Venenivibrio stagnispumantis TaxID=407998 RepID=A0AA45WL93_9AQUI|nr:type II secretion system protein [Venenivibrio stagnispumantis]MCW4573341.1 type II secretion system GspH family protein [Venenivibrio stagnispumantis]SMP10608.1 type IV pilus assembly protein PilV [Venenivibrio stagnispumantis]